MRAPRERVANLIATKPMNWTALLSSLSVLPYGGEPVDQLAHALQCGLHAVAAGADDGLVAASILHDIGRAPDVAAAQAGVPHELLAEQLCAEHVSERVAWLVGRHAEAKRFLVTTDPAYHDSLSPVSQATFTVQGGWMTPEEVAVFRTHPWHADAVALRRWDDLAKEPDARQLSLEPAVAAIARATEI